MCRQRGSYRGPPTCAAPHTKQPITQYIIRAFITLKAFGYIDTLLHLIFTRKSSRGRDPLQSISLRRKTLSNSSLRRSIYKFFGGRRVLLAEIPYWCWTLVTQVLVTGNQGAPRLFYNRQELHLFGSPFYRQFVLALAVPSRSHL